MKPQGSERNAIKRGNDSGLDFGILWSLVGAIVSKRKLASSVI